jgi:hypothetical protein
MFVFINFAVKIKFRIVSTCYPEPDLLPIPQHAWPSAHGTEVYIIIQDDIPLFKAKCAIPK